MSSISIALAEVSEFWVRSVILESFNFNATWTGMNLDHECDCDFFFSDDWAIIF